MRVIIDGWAEASESDVRRAMEACGGDEVKEVVSSRLAGASEEGAKWAERRGILVRRHIADWSRYGLQGGRMRSKEMVKSADAVVVVQRGEVRESKYLLREAKKRGLRTCIYRVDTGAASIREGRT